jgi:hypothetical protein
MTRTAILGELFKLSPGMAGLAGDMAVLPRQRKGGSIVVEVFGGNGGRIPVRGQTERDVHEKEYPSEEYRRNCGDQQH